jgi:hypothetical protein
MIKTREVPSLSLSLSLFLSLPVRVIGKEGLKEGMSSFS